MMERPQVNIEPPVDQYDHELTPTQANVVALADELLTHKPEDLPVTFVDIILTDDPNEMLAELEAGPLGHLLASPEKQLAFTADSGGYYPQLDVRKMNGQLTGMSLRVWGWDYKKVRYTDPDNKKPPFKYKKYRGEIDKSRQLEISMGYQVGDQTMNESLSVHASSERQGLVYASSHVYMHAYMDQGYEGHGGESDYRISDEAVEWFLEFIAKHVGDQPKSFRERDAEIVEQIRDLARERGVLEDIDELIAATWHAQAIYLLGRPSELLDGKSVYTCLKSPDTAARAAEVVREIVKRWKSRK